MLSFQEASNNLTKVLNILSVDFGVEFELIFEQFMLLLEDSNASQAV